MGSECKVGGVEEGGFAHFLILILCATPGQYCHCIHTSSSTLLHLVPTHYHGKVLSVLYIYQSVPKILYNRTSSKDTPEMRQARTPH